MPPRASTQRASCPAVAIPQAASWNPASCFCPGWSLQPKHGLLTLEDLGQPLVLLQQMVHRVQAVAAAARPAQQPVGV